MSNPLLEIQKFGQSAWLDYIHRDDLNNGDLQRRIDEEGVLGVTSNPSIFQKAIGDSDTYDDAIMTMLDLEAQDIYEALAIEDIQNATDLFRPIYERTAGGDGYVSLEVSPLLARDTQGTIDEAKRLFETVGRPNLMIKIPATPEGIPAIEDTIAAGINVNVTLIFAINNYERVAEAFIRGLERRLAAGEDVTRVASVASFFLSRIDAMVDQMLENNIRAAQVRQDTARIAANRVLLGQTAIANAKMAYKSFQRIFQGERFEALREAGALAQRPLWASTSTKNPPIPIRSTSIISSVRIRSTPCRRPPWPPSRITAPSPRRSPKRPVNFLPPEEALDRLAEVGIDMGQVTSRLQEDGVDAFIDSFETLISQVAAKRTLLRSGIIERTKLALGIYHGAVDEAIAGLDADFANPRLWNKDGSLWKPGAATIKKIVDRLGWLDFDIDHRSRAASGAARQHARWPLQACRSAGHGRQFAGAGSAGDTFGPQRASRELIVLDSTDPARIRQVEAQIELENTLFVVASKSGGTIETLALDHYFWERTGGAAEQFIVITDPGSNLETIARKAGVRDIFLNPADIGGRYSALSYFGMVPAALIGLDLDGLWASADTMLAANRESIPSSYHPGLLLGAVIGALAKEGRDKVTIYTSGVAAELRQLG